MFAQTEVEQEEMLPKVANFLAQLSEDQIDSMESYLVQMEQAKESGDDATLAQLGSDLDENLSAVADYLVQLDDGELGELNTLL